MEHRFRVALVVHTCAMTRDMCGMTSVSVMRSHLSNSCPGFGAVEYMVLGVFALAFPRQTPLLGDLCLGVRQRRQRSVMVDL